MRLAAIGRRWRCSLRRRGRRTRATSGMMIEALPPMPKGVLPLAATKLIAIPSAGKIFLKQYCYLYSWRISSRAAKLSKILLSILRQLQLVLERKCYQLHQVPKRYLRKGCYHPHPLATLFPQTPPLPVLATPWYSSATPRCIRCNSRSCSTRCFSRSLTNTATLGYSLITYFKRFATRSLACQRLQRLQLSGFPPPSA